jgi:hypothetical protein
MRHIYKLLFGLSLLGFPAFGFAQRTVAYTDNPVIVHGMKNQGAYSAGTTYSINDVVTYSGSSYLSLVADNVGHTPSSSPTQWQAIGSSVSIPSTGMLKSVSGVLTTATAGTDYPTVASVTSAASAASAAQTTASAAIPATQKAAANGVAPLDGTGKVPGANMPATVPSFDTTRATLWDVFDLHEGSGTTLTGIVNGNTCTLAGQTGSDPVWSGKSLVFSSATTSFITCSGMTTPVVVQVVASYIPVTTPQFQTFAGVGSAVTNGFYFIPTPSAVPSITPHFTLGVNGAANVLGMGAVGNGIQALTLSMGSTAYEYINTDSIPAIAGAVSIGSFPAPTGAAFTVGGSLGQAGCAPHVCQFHSGSIFGFAVYSTQPATKADTDALVAQNQQAWSTLLLSHGYTLGSYVNNNPSTVAALICLGTSIEAGTGSNIAACTNANTGLSASAYTPFNLGVPSSYLTAMVGANLQMAKFADVPTAPRKIIFHGNAVTNDMALGLITPAAAYTMLQRAIVLDRKVMNPSYIIVGTQFSRNTQDANRDTWNASVRGGSADSGYRVCDIAANPLLGADGAYANTTYFGDGIHPTAAGQAIYGGIIGRCITYFDGSTQSNPTVSTSNTYVMTVADAYLIHTPSAAGTPTLPECIGLTGYSFNIFNASGSFSDTFSTTASETITGSNVVGPNTQAKFTVQFSGPTTAGCYWLRTQ